MPVFLNQTISDFFQTVKSFPLNVRVCCAIDTAKVKDESKGIFDRCVRISTKQNRISLTSKNQQ